MLKRGFFLLCVFCGLFFFGCETVSVFKSGDLNMDDVNRMLKLEHGLSSTGEEIGVLGLLRKADVWMETNLW
ncbi:MAG: hypothetical protein JW788_00550 [Candidatus Omnitrophica bacterium]|nr:hypothetical protein [Candidatus Omnitrophota bacterium]